MTEDEPGEDGEVRPEPPELGRPVRRLVGFGMVALSLGFFFGVRRVLRPFGVSITRW